MVHLLDNKFPNGLSLPFDHVVAPFIYASIPPMADLKKVYKGGVSAIYESRKWGRHASAIVSTRSGDHIVWLARPPGYVLSDSEKIIAWGRDQRTEVAPQGYRPITGEDELLDLHRAHPELCGQFWMVALGSFAFGRGNDRIVAVLWTSSDSPNAVPRLDDEWFDHDFRQRAGRFPFVPQVSA